MKPTKDTLKELIGKIIYGNIFGDAQPRLTCQPHQLVDELMEKVWELIESKP